MKKVSLILLLIGVTVHAENNFNLKVGAYNRTLDENAYITLVFKPFFVYNDFFGGLGFEFSFKSDSTLKQDDWDNTRAIVEKLYLGYGKKGDKIVVRVSSLEEVNFGYGILVNNFRNDVYYPNRIKPGFLFSVDYNYFGLQSFIDDVYDFDLLGSRIFLRPIGFIKNEAIPDYIKRFEIGGFFIGDWDNFDKDSGGGGTYYLSKDESLSQKVRFYGFDLSIPFFEEKGLFTGSNFIEYAKLHDYGSGLSYGVVLKFIDFINVKGSVIYSWGGFLPNYFSTFYMVRTVRATIYETAKSAGVGWNFLSSLWFEIKSLKFGLDLYYTKNGGTTFTFYTDLEPELLKGFFIKFFYSKRGIKNLMDTFDIITGKDRMFSLFEVGYQITRNAYISVRYVKSFKETDGVVTNSSLTEIQTNIVF